MVAMHFFPRSLGSHRVAQGPSAWKWTTSKSSSAVMSDPITLLDMAANPFTSSVGTRRTFTPL